MHERLLDKKTVPTIDDMAIYCNGLEEIYCTRNNELSEQYRNTTHIRFTYGNKYGGSIKICKGKR